MIITKFIHPILLFGRMQGKRSSRLENQAVAGTTPVMPVVAREDPASEVRKIVNDSVVTFEGTYQGKPIRIRIFNESKDLD